MLNESLNQDSRELVAKLARQVSARGLTAPAVFLLEMYKPLTSLINTAALSVPVLLVPLFGAQLARAAGGILNSKDGIEALIRAIEEQTHGV